MEDLARQLSTLGPYFAVDVHGRGDVREPPWARFEALFTADPATPPAPSSLPGRVAATRAALATMASVTPERVHPRVAGSIAHLGLAARLVAPVLGAIALTGRAPALDDAAIWWQPVLGGPVPLSLAGPSVLAEPAVEALLTGPISRLVEAAEALSVAPTVLWGNVASGVGGAVGQILLRLPDRGDDVLAAAELFLRHPLLAGSYEGTCGFDFRRRSCCLIYQLGPAGPARYCGDCILRVR